MSNDIETALLNIESRLRDMIAEKAMHDAAVSLVTNKGWEELQERMKTILKGETERLIHTKLDQYKLGLLQGFIKALRLFTNVRTLSADELADLDQNVRLTEQDLDKTRRLLD